MKMECSGCGKTIKKSYSRIFPICKECIKLKGLVVFDHQGKVSKPTVDHYHEECNCFDCEHNRSCGVDFQWKNHTKIGVE